MGAWDDLPADYSPFKVVCLAREVHRGSQLCERGGAAEGGDGFVSVAWKPRAGRTVPQSGTGAANEGGGRTYTLTCEVPEAEAGPACEAGAPAAGAVGGGRRGFQGAGGAGSCRTCVLAC